MQEDNFPPSICLRINGKMASLPVSAAPCVKCTDEKTLMGPRRRRRPSVPVAASCHVSLRCLTGPRPAKSTGLPCRLLFFVTPSTGLLGGRAFLPVLEKLHFLIYKFFLILIYVLCGLTVCLSDNRLAAACN